MLGGPEGLSVRLFRGTQHACEPKPHGVEHQTAVVGGTSHDILPDDIYFYDTDHLNRAGVSAFGDDYLVPLLKNISRF